MYHAVVGTRGRLTWTKSSSVVLIAWIFANGNLPRSSDYKEGKTYMNVSRRSKIDTRWYLTVRCEKCLLPILFALDHRHGEEGSYLPSHEKLVLTCTLDTCKHRGDYTGADVVRFQKQPVATSAISA
jgi:hypothetical protein